MAKGKRKVVKQEGLSIKVDLSKTHDEFGKKLKVKVTLLQDGKPVSEDEDFVKLPL